MLAIRINIEQIDYEKSFENLIPRLIEKSSSKSEMTEIERLLVKLGPDAVPVTKKILSYLDENARDQIIVWLLDSHQDRFIETANHALKESLSGNVITIGGFSAEDLPGTELTLYASQVRIDYEKLISSRVPGSGVLGSAAKIAVQMASPATIEKQGISLLSSDMIRPKLVSILSESIQKSGLIMTIRDVELRDDPAIRLPGNTLNDGKFLPDAIENHILDAIAAWLRESQ